MAAPVERRAARDHLDLPVWQEMALGDSRRFPGGNPSARRRPPLVVDPPMKPIDPALEQRAVNLRAMRGRPPVGLDQFRCEWDYMTDSEKTLAGLGREYRRLLLEIVVPLEEANDGRELGPVDKIRWNEALQQALDII